MGFVRATKFGLRDLKGRTTVGVIVGEGAGDFSVVGGNNFLGDTTSGILSGAVPGFGVDT